MESKFANSSFSDAEKLAMIKQADKRRKDHPRETLSQTITALQLDGKLTQSRYYTWRDIAVRDGNLKQLQRGGPQPNHPKKLKAKAKANGHAQPSLEATPTMQFPIATIPRVSTVRKSKTSAVIDVQPLPQADRLADLFDSIARLLRG